MAQVNLFNRTEKEISDVVEGHQIIIPANGSTQVSERKANAMMDAYSGKLSLTPTPDYSDADKELVGTMRKNNVIPFALALMDGEKPDPNDYMDKSTQSESQGSSESSATPGA